MDPLTQGVLGATLPQSASRKKHIAIAGFIGCIGGIAPDVDVFIRSDSDPLLFLEYHRQFTHSLFFIPVGGLIVGLILYGLLGQRWNLSPKLSIAFATLGYGTHALLDACTTYGTQLLWPFSEQRFAWNAISIIDPAYTLPILTLVLIAGYKKQPLLARIALAWVFAYPAIGLIQRDRAIEVGRELAASRGLDPTRLEAKPTLANLLVWKIVCETDDYFYVDAVRVGLDTKIYSGDVIATLDIDRDLPWLDQNSQQAKDVERFSWFSNGYVAIDPVLPNRVIDVRYSVLPNEINALWSIELMPGAAPEVHAQYLNHRDRSPETIQKFRDMVFGREATSKSIAVDSSNSQQAPGKNLPSG